MERKLATVEPVLDVAAIDGADAIESIVVRGWNVVVKKGEFAVGDLCVYFEIDSFLPLDDERFAFLASRGTRTIDGQAGHVLRTAKLRGTFSQGLAIGVAAFPELDDIETLAESGENIAGQLGIVKWDPPLPAALAGFALGPFPTQFAPKTDAERVENLTSVYSQLASHDWVATEKIDGTSVTYIRDSGRLRVCSRNLELAAGDGTQWRLADELGILDLLDDGDALQGEIFGEGIQSNPLKQRGQHFRAFALWRGRRNVPRSAWNDPLLQLAAPCYDLTLPDSVEACVAQADGIRSLVAPGVLAEGVVWHSADGATFGELDGRGCFKAISRTWLVKHSD